MDYVTIQVPFVYSAKARKANHRVDRDLMFGAFHEVKVPVLEGDMAPAAATWRKVDRSLHSDGDNDVNAQVDEARTLRVFNDALYKVYGRGSAPITLEAFRDLENLKMGNHPLSGAYSNHPYAAERMAFHDFGRGKLEDAAEFKVSSSTEDVERAKIESHASYFIIVDGVLLTTTKEPLIAVTRSSSFDYKCADIDIIFDYEANRIQQQVLFAMDELDNAAAYAEQYIAEKAPHHHAWITHKFSDLEVLIPEVFTVDPSVDQYLALAMQIRDENKKDVLDWGIDACATWHNLNDAICDLHAKRDRETTGLVFEKCKALMTLSETKRNRTSFYYSELDRAMERLENQPVRGVSFRM